MSDTSYLKWKPRYSVGNSDLDAQHQYMFALLDKMYAAMQDGGTDTPLEQLLDKARLYGKLHFETEERLMAECGYPLWLEHRQVHEEYCDRVEKMSQNIGPDTWLELFLFLKDWWVNHITSKDAEYAPWVSKGPTQRPGNT
jgi:hemerythrin